MPDYKELYLAMIRASESAIRTLVEAQRQCEDMILDEMEETETEQQTGRT